MWHDGGEDRCTHDFSGKTEGKDHLEDQAVDGRILEWILKNLFGGGGGWSELIWLRTGSRGGSYKGENKV